MNRAPVDVSKSEKPDEQVEGAEGQTAEGQTNQSEDFTRWPLRTRGYVTFLQKKSIEKSYLNHFYGPKNMRNRSSMLELLFLALKNTSKLLLSSEIGQFQLKNIALKILENPYISLCPNSRDFNGKSGKSAKIHLLNFKLTYLGAQEEFGSVLGMVFFSQEENISSAVFLPKISSAPKNFAASRRFPSKHCI